VFARYAADFGNVMLWIFAVYSFAEPEQSVFCKAIRDNTAKPIITKITLPPT